MKYIETDWFPYNVKPVRSGVYKVKYKLYEGIRKPIEGEGWSYFDGQYWAYCEPTHGLAEWYMRNDVMRKGTQNKLWKGILK